MPPLSESVSSAGSAAEGWTSLQGDFVLACITQARDALHHDGVFDGVQEHKSVAASQSVWFGIFFVVACFFPRLFVPVESHRPCLVPVLCCVLCLAVCFVLAARSAYRYRSGITPSASRRR